MNVFDEYRPSDKVYEIAALGGAEITLRDLSLEEGLEIGQLSLTGMNPDGSPIVNTKEANLSKYRKISAALVDPVMSVDDLLSLSNQSSDALDEIFALVDPQTALLIKEAKGKADSGK